MVCVDFFNSREAVFSCRNIGRKKRKGLTYGFSVIVTSVLYFLVNFCLVLNPYDNYDHFQKLLEFFNNFDFCLPHGRPRGTSFPSSPGDFLLFWVGKLLNIDP